MSTYYPVDTSREQTPCSERRFSPAWMEEQALLAGVQFEIVLHIGG